MHQNEYRFSKIFSGVTPPNPPHGRGDPLPDPPTPPPNDLRRCAPPVVRLLGPKSRAFGARSQI